MPWKALTSLSTITCWLMQLWRRAAECFCLVFDVFWACGCCAEQPGEFTNAFLCGEKLKLPLLVWIFSQKPFRAGRWFPRTGRVTNRLKLAFRKRMEVFFCPPGWTGITKTYDFWTGTLCSKQWCSLWTKNVVCIQRGNSVRWHSLWLKCSVAHSQHRRIGNVPRWSLWACAGSAPRKIYAWLTTWLRLPALISMLWYCHSCPLGRYIMSSQAQ